MILKGFDIEIITKLKHRNKSGFYINKCVKNM